MRLGERLGIDAETASQTYYACLLFYVGCTADAEIAAETFGDDDALAMHFHPVMFGVAAVRRWRVMRALATPGSPAPLRAVQVARRLPTAMRRHQRHVAALCEVAEMLTGRLGLPAAVPSLFAALAERWDGKGDPGRLERDQIPLSLRISHVARDASLGGEEHAVRVVRERAGRSVRSDDRGPVAEDAADILEPADGSTCLDASGGGAVRDEHGLATWGELPMGGADRRP